MKKTLTYILLFFAGLTIFQSCQKEPEAHFSVESPVEAGENLKISNYSKDAYWYEWWNGDDYWTSEMNPSWSYNQVGTYEIILIAYSRNSEKSSQATQSVVVNPNATVTNFVANRTEIVENQSVHFNDLSINTPTSWSWVFGDGSTATIQNVTHVYTTMGTYTVSLIASNVSGSDVETKVDYIIVSKAGSAPVANFTADTTIISVGDTINFIDLSSNTPTSWLWNFGDGTTSTQQNPTHLYTTTNTYTVTLTVANTIGSDTEIKNNYIIVELPWQCGESFIDNRDSQIYQTVQIGSQCWMAENLNYGTRINGSENQSNNLIIEKYCFNNDENNCNSYGGLYQWNEMMQYNPGDFGNIGTVKGICPSGWHIPTDEEWKTLEMYLGMTRAQVDSVQLRGTNQGEMLKLGGNTNFNALITGVRDCCGSFIWGGHGTFFWTSSDRNSSLAWERYLYSNSNKIGRYYYTNKNAGFSVRCVRTNK